MLEGFRWMEQPNPRGKRRRRGQQAPERTQLSQSTPPDVRMPRGYYPDDGPTMPAEAQPRRGRRVRRPRPEGQRGIFAGYTPKAIVVGSIAGISAFALLIGMMVIGYYLYFQIFNRIVPGVHVGDVRLDGLNRTQAMALLEEKWGSGQGIILSDGQQNWVASPTEFGMTLEPGLTAQRAFDVGHNGPLVGEFVTLFDSTANGTGVAPVVTFDAAKAREGLVAWSERINRPPQDASIRIELGQVIPVAGVQGYSLNVDATLAIIAADPAAAIQNSYLPLVLDPVAPRIADASGAVAEAQALLDAPLEVRAYDPITDENLSWTVEPTVIASWLGVQTDDAGPHVVVQADRLTAWVAETNAGLGEGRSLNPDESAPEVEAALKAGRTATLIVKHLPTTYTVVSGDNLTRIAWKVGVPYWRIMDANPGLDSNGLTPGQTLTIPSKDDLLPLPVVAHKRIIIDISDQHLWAYENGAEVHSFVISTGIDRSPTQPGVFQVQEHSASVYQGMWDLTMPHFLSIYESWPGFFNGTHGLPTLSSGAILWRDVLGSPASYGCIILDLDDAEVLYNWAEDGVVVEIRE